MRELIQLWICLLCLVTQKGLCGDTNRPRIVEHPQNTFVVKNEPATLNCKAEGTPPPVISWFRSGKPVITANENPSSHRMLLPNGQLFFLRVIHSKNNKPDIGTYFCRATNPETGAFAQSRNATLDIAVIRDDFRVQPQSKDIGASDTATIECRGPKGSPDPKIKWQKNGEPLTSNGRINIAANGNLVINSVRREDSGLYVCIAFNNAGERESNPIRLAVKDKPKIIVLPENQVVGEGADAAFSCQAVGDPRPTIIWRKEEGQIPSDRAHMLGDNSLKIEDVAVTDEGTYVCRAENSVGYAEALARLTIHIPPSFKRYPMDKVVSVGTRVILRCEADGHPPPAVFWSQENSEVFMFPHQHVGRFSVTDEGTLIIESVRKQDGGEYMCEALNVAGSTTAKAKIQVIDIDDGGVQPTELEDADFLAVVSQELSDQVVHVTQPHVLNSTAVQLQWEILKAHKFIQGFHIKYRVMPDYEDHYSSGHVHHHVEFEIQTAKQTATSYVLKNLKKYTWYEIKIQPYYLSIEGQDSNTVRVQTFQDVPSAPPQDVVATPHDNTTLLIKWSPPPLDHQNGLLTGYKLYITGVNIEYNRSIAVNSSLNAYMLHEVSPDKWFKIRIQAINRMGPGPMSLPFVLGGDSAQGLVQEVTREPWFIAAVIITIGCTLCVLLCVFSVWLYRKRKKRKNLYQNGVRTVPVHKVEDLSRSEMANQVPLLANHCGFLTGEKRPEQSHTLCMKPCCSCDISPSDGDGLHRIDSDGYQILDDLQPDQRHSGEHSVTTPNGYVRVASDDLYDMPPVPAYATTSLLKKREASFHKEKNGNVLQTLQDCPLQVKGDTDYTSQDLDNPWYRPPSSLPTRMSSIPHPLFFIPPPPPPQHSPNSEMEHMHTWGGRAVKKAKRKDLPTSEHGNLYRPASICSSDFHTKPKENEYKQRRPQSNLEGQHHQLRNNNPEIKPPTPQKETEKNNEQLSPDKPHNQPSNQTNALLIKSVDRPYSPGALSEPEPQIDNRLIHLSNGDIPKHYSDTEGMEGIYKRRGMESPPPPAPNHNPEPDPYVDRACQSSLPSLDQDYGSSSDRLDDLENIPADSDTDPTWRAECGSPGESSIEDLESTVTGSNAATWTATSCSSIKSSAASLSDGDDSLFTDGDFANAVARMTELSGLVMSEALAMDSLPNKEKSKKPAKLRERAPRPISPYSTDSSYSNMEITHKPYPKSERKKQLQEQKAIRHRKHLEGVSSRDRKQRPYPKIKGIGSSLLDSTVPSYGTKPDYSEHLQYEQGISEEGGDSKANTILNGMRFNPLLAFDATETPIV